MPRKGPNKQKAWRKNARHINNLLGAKHKGRRYKNMPLDAVAGMLRQQMIAEAVEDAKAEAVEQEEVAETEGAGV